MHFFFVFVSFFFYTKNNYFGFYSVLLIRALKNGEGRAGDGEEQIEWVICVVTWHMS